MLKVSKGLGGNALKQQEDGFIYELVDKYLNSTNLSLRQVANKWEISPSLLSLIKNKKRRPNIDIALKIMQANKIPAENQAAYVAKRNESRSKNFHHIKKELDESNRTKLLTENFSKILESEPYAIDIFLEVSLAGELGKSHPALYREYGSLGIRVANLLAESEFITKENNRYFMDETDCNFKPTRLQAKVGNIPRPVIKFDRNNRNFKKEEWQLAWQSIHMPVPTKVKGFTTKQTALKALEVFVTNNRQGLFDEKSLETIYKYCKQANSEFNNRQNNQKNAIVRDLLYQGYFQHSSMQIEPIVSDDFQEKFVPKLVFKFPCRML
jgi:transcriptional regulator with XRE-family HTH domain